MKCGLNDYSKTALPEIIGMQATEALDEYLRTNEILCWDIACQDDPDIKQDGVE